MNENFFHPQKDITAYELAVIYANLTLKPETPVRPVKKHPILFSEEQWDGLGELQRHFAASPMS